MYVCFSHLRQKLICGHFAKERKDLYLWESKQPEHRVLNPVEDVHPHPQGGRVNLVQLVEVAVDDGVLRESVLATRRD